MLDRQWRARVRRAATATAGPQRGDLAQPRLQSDRAALDLSRLQGTDRRSAEHSGAELSRAARALRPLSGPHQRRAIPRSRCCAALLSGRGCMAIRLSARRRRCAHRHHLVSDRADLHRSGPSTAARLPDAAAAVARPAGEPRRLGAPAIEQSAGGLRSSAIAGAALGYLSLWAVYHAFRLLTGKEGMGYGDFKLLAAFGAWLGWRMLLPIVLLSAIVGALVGIALIVARRHERGTPIPFGPFLAAAGWVAMMWGPQIVAGLPVPLRRSRHDEQRHRRRPARGHRAWGSQAVLPAARARSRACSRLLACRSSMRT